MPKQGFEIRNATEEWRVKCSCGHTATGSISDPIYVQACIYLCNSCQCKLVDQIFENWAIRYIPENH